MEVLLSQVFFDNEGREGNPVLLALLKKEESKYFSDVLLTLQTLLQSIQDQNTPPLEVLQQLDLSDNILQTLFDHHVLTACCAVIHIDGVQHHNVVRAQYFNATHLIQCCGHGLFALSDVLFQRFPSLSSIDYASLATAYKKSHHHLSPVTVLSLPILAVEDISIPEFCNAELTDAEILSAWQTENAQGYLLLEVNSNIDLASLEVNVNCLEQYTLRACLIFQRKKTHGQWCITMRYFAPQYGVREDLATASVVRVLAFILPVTKALEHVTIIQASAAGASFSLHRQTTDVLIRGNSKVVYANEIEK